MVRLHLLLCLLAAVLLLLLFSPSARSATYEIVVHEKTFSANCEEENNKGNVLISDFMVMSNLNLVLEEDLETFHASADFTVAMEIPSGPISMDIEMKRWKRNQWVPIIVGLKRKDMCKSVEDKFEPWHHYVTTQIPKSVRVCPPKLGHVYNIRNISNRVVLNNLPRWDIEGEIKAIDRFTIGNLSTCVVAYATVTIH